MSESLQTQAEYTASLAGKLTDCYMCHGHNIIVNKRLVPQKIDGQLFEYDFHCTTDNKLVYLK